MQNENKWRIAANERFAALRKELDLEQGKTAFLKHQIKNSQSLFLVTAPCFSSWIHFFRLIALSDFHLTKAIAKAKSIVEQSKHIQELNDENKILKDLADAVKGHEATMKVLQESADAEMQRLKDEITQLKEQNQAAKEQNDRNLEVYKTVQKERDVLAKTCKQAETSIFGNLSPSWSFLYFWIIIQFVCAHGPCSCANHSSHWLSQLG